MKGKTSSRKSKKSNSRAKTIPVKKENVDLFWAKVFAQTNPIIEAHRKVLVRSMAEAHTQYFV